MVKPLGLFVFTSIACFSLTPGCGSTDSGSVSVGGGTSMTIPSPGGASQFGGGASGSAEASLTAAGTAGMTSTTAGTAGITSSIGGGSGTGGGGQSNGGGGGSAVVAGAGGMSGGAGAGGGVNGHVRIGMSAGCNKAPPAADSTTKFVKHEVHMAGLDAVYLKGGKNYASDGPYDYTFRPYGIQLPTNYDPSKRYAVTFGAGGCGGSATNFASHPDGSFQIAPQGTTLQVGLSYLGPCFNDGGPSIDNRVDTPDEPYFRAVMKDLEANYCFDLSKVFVGGYSSGGWESYLLGCATADLVRGIGADEGGQRAMHPVCKNPVAAVLVAGETDTENPIGPLTLDSDAGKRLGSYGSGPSRDEILMRNGCTGTATVPADAKYPACVKYTGCPAAYPVIWCSLPNTGHNNSKYDNVEYSPGMMWDVLGALPAPT